MMDTSGSTSRSIISCLGLEIFVQINRILTKFCHMKVEGSGNYETPCIYGGAPHATELNHPCAVANAALCQITLITHLLT